MIQQITKGIKISIETAFEGTFYKNDSIHYAFSYEITIENQSSEIAQLIARKWNIMEVQWGSKCKHSNSYSINRYWYTWFSRGKMWCLCTTSPGWVNTFLWSSFKWLWCSFVKNKLSTRSSSRPTMYKAV